MTQKERILEALQRGERLTILQSLQTYGVFRLASRISELKKDGHDIKKRMKPVHTRFDDETKIAEYWMENV